MMPKLNSGRNPFSLILELINLYHLIVSSLVATFVVVFANSLDSDQLILWPDLDLNKLFDTLKVFLKDFFEKKNIFYKSTDDNRSY